MSSPESPTSLLPTTILCLPTATIWACRSSSRLGFTRRLTGERDLRPLTSTSDLRPPTSDLTRPLSGFTHSHWPFRSGQQLTCRRRLARHDFDSASAADVLATGTEVPQPHALFPRRQGSRGEGTRRRALLLDAEGRVSETSTANILIHEIGTGLISPPRASVLPGVSLEVVIELAAKLRHSVHRARDLARRRGGGR